jgi:FkbM family methyltransferase
MKNWFWTRVEGQLQYRNLGAEEWAFRHEIVPSWRAKKIDEPVFIYYEIYDAHSAGYVDECMYQLMDCTIQPGDYVVDLGANIGIFSNRASELGAAKVYSFEPVKENFELLMLNRPHNCEPFKLAVSDQDLQSFQIAYKPEAPGGSSIVKYEDGQLQPCLTITLDTLLSSGLIPKIDFLKVDIEGAEVLAFKGISDENLKRIRCVSMEMHVPEIGPEGTKYIYDRFERLGFKTYTIWQGGYDQVYFWQNK